MVSSYYELEAKHLKRHRLVDGVQTVGGCFSQAVATLIYRLLNFLIGFHRKVFLSRTETDLNYWLAYFKASILHRHLHVSLPVAVGSDDALYDRNQQVAVEAQFFSLKLGGFTNLLKDERLSHPAFLDDG